MPFLHFKSYIFCFFFLPYYIIMNSRTKLNRSGYSVHLYLKESFQYFKLSMIFAVGVFLWIVFVILWKLCSVPTLPRVFIIVLNFIKLCFCIYWEYCMMFYFILLMWLNILIDFLNLNQPYIPRKKSKLVMMYYPFVNIAGFCLLWFFWGFLNKCSWWT